MWGAFVTASINTGRTPFDLMNDALAGKLDGAGGSGGSGGSGGGGGGGGPYTNTTVQLTDRSTAHALVDSALQSYLGRDATAKERKEFYSILQNREQGNPTVESGVTSKGGTSRVVSGGTNQQEAAKEFAQSRDDYSEFQAATTYLDAFIGSLKNPTGMI